MDIIEGLPPTLGYNAIFVVVDKLSKYGTFLPFCHPLTAKYFAELFIKEVMGLNGFLRSIISNRDKISVSHFWTKFSKMQGTQLKGSMAFHPQTDEKS